MLFIVSMSTYGLLAILRKVTVMGAEQRACGALLLLVAQVSIVTACSATIEDSGSGTDTGTETGATVVDLFACGLEPSCDPMWRHLGVEPLAAAECAARLVLGGGTGVITSIDAPGPFIDETETLVVVLGDGTGLVQTRERHCLRDDGQCEANPPWETPSRHQLCDLEVSSSVKEACEENLEQCFWTPWDVTNCRDVEDSTCDDIAGRL
ncbi:hypothetical protein [Sorangium sp. So ce233]|uniref:hypothetical protein n=1 Tax=Sorangium sp. So ce233 TaxID=3133290 RepID=UPI003F614A4D